MREQLIEILKELSEVIKLTGINPSNDIIFSKAIDIFIAETIEVNKDRRTAQINESPDKKSASSRQINFLINLGFRGETKDLTSTEATQLIKEYLAKQSLEKQKEGGKQETW